MTPPWRQYVPCPVCGAQVSTEQPIDAWIRNHSQLQSDDGIVISDSDKWVHRYAVRTKGQLNRDVQYIMLVEIKTFARKESASQSDTLGIVNQLIRTVAWKFQRDSGRFTTGHPHNVHLVFSSYSGRNVQTISYGKHTLCLSASTPEDSQWMTWDGKRISVDQLVLLLRFDLHPDSMKQNEHRRHKKINRDITLFDGTEDGAALPSRDQKRQLICVFGAGPARCLLWAAGVAHAPCFR